MKCTAEVRKHIGAVGCDTPIFLDDIRRIAGDNAKTIMSRLAKDGTVARFGRGVYYKPTTTVWGTSVLGRDTVLLRKYIQDEDGGIKGYITGARLFNRMGLTTQVPRTTEIVSNECRCKNKVATEYGAVVRRPRLKVDNDNHLYQQFLDVVENRTNVHIEAEAPQDILRAFFKENRLDFATLYKIGLARGTAERHLRGIGRIVLG
jgi:hypothetical protein